MRILVSGGAGFIGSHIVDKLLARGHTVFVVDDLSTGKSENIDRHANSKNFHFIAGDIVNKQDVAYIYATLNPDAVCHQAAQASLLRSHEDPYRDALVNVIGTVNMLRYAEMAGCTKFVMASTMAVFGNSEMAPDETTLVNPQRPYGISKMAAEQYVRNARIKWAILRYGNVYGPRQIPIGENQLIARIFSFLRFGAPPFSVYGDGSHTRDFVFVNDIANANVAVLEGDHTGIFHLGTQVDHSVNGVIQVIEKLGYTFEHINHAPEKEEPSMLRVMSKRAKLIEGYYPTTPLDDGLRATDAWWRER